MTDVENDVDSGALIARIEQLIDQGRPGAARPLLLAARELGQSQADLSVLAARIALSGDTPETAEAELDHAVEAAPEHAGLRKCRAQLRGRLGNLEGATRDAAEAVICDRTDPEAKALLGELLLHLGRTPEAVSCLLEAVKAAPRGVVFRETLAQALIADGDLDGAMETLIEGMAAVPQAIAIRNAAILLCIRMRDFAQADRLAEDARLHGVADASTFGLRGHALSSLGRHKEAAIAYNEAFKLAPGDPYVRHLAKSSANVEGDEYVRALFDGYADRFESHLIELGYRIPGLIRRHVAEFAAIANIGPVLDLGCGTGLMALALTDIATGPVTGVDISARMLERARAKELYATLTEARLPDFLHAAADSWRLIVAADVLCYFGALEEMLTAVRARMRQGGRFIFSVEELLPNHDGTVPGNGEWALGRLGRYAHSIEYVTKAADACGFRRLALERETLRYEAGGPVSGLIVLLERPRENA